MAANTASTGTYLTELADLPGVRECLQFFTREKQWINEIHLQLCRVPAPTFLEQERAAWFLEQFRAAGWEASIDRAGNVLAAIGEAPYVALTAHLDTVLAPRTKDDIAVDTEGRFHGAGVSDNGAGLAALLAIARAWKNSPRLPEFPRGLLLVANVGEEGEGNLLGMRHLCKQSPMAKKIHSFLIVDGANNDHITTRGLGSRRFEVAFSGPGGHSWSDFGVGNPVHALCRAVALFAETRLDSGPKSSVNVGLIEGGSGVNAIAQSARCKVDIRSESNSRMDQLVDILNSAVDRARDLENQRATSGRVAVKTREIGSRPAATLPEQSPILQYIRAVDSHLGIRSHQDCSSTDANIPLAMGIPAIAIGAGGLGGGAHTPQEWFSPDGRDLGLKRVLLTLLLLMRDPGGQREVNRRKADLALLFNAFIWGSTFILVKSAIGYVSPLLFLAIRFSLATVALMLLFRGTWKWRRRVTRKMIGAGCLAGVFLFSGYALQTIGLRLTTAPKSAFLTGLATVMVPLLAALVYKIKPQISEVFGVLIATFGMGLMTIEGPIDSIGRGDLLTLGGAIAFAAHIVTLGHFSEQIGYELLSVTQVAAASVASISLFWWAETPRFQWQPVILWAILITGLFCTALAFTIQAWAQRYTTSTRTALIYALEPVVAWATSFVVAGEGLSGRAAAGAVLILSGVLLVEMKPLQPRAHPLI